MKEMKYCVICILIVVAFVFVWAVVDEYTTEKNKYGTPCGFHDKSHNMVIDEQDYGSETSVYNDNEEFFKNAIEWKNCVENCSKVYDDNGEAIGCFNTKVYRGMKDAFELDGIVSGKDKVEYNNFIYEYALCEVKATETKPAKKVPKTIIKDSAGNEVGRISNVGQDYYIHNDKLIIVKYLPKSREEYVGDNEKLYAHTYVYDLSSPQSPELVKEFRQSGVTQKSYMKDGYLYVMTAKTVYSIMGENDKLKCNVEEVKPVFQKSNGADEGEFETYSLSDEEIMILGSPGYIEYVAISKIDMDSREIIKKKVYYSSCEDVRLNAGCLIFNVNSGELYGYPISALFWIDNGNLEYRNKFVHMGLCRSLNDCDKYTDDYECEITEEQSHYISHSCFRIDSYMEKDDVCYIVGKFYYMKEGWSGENSEQCDAYSLAAIKYYCKDNKAELRMIEEFPKATDIHVHKKLTWDEEENMAVALLCIEKKGDYYNGKKDGIVIDFTDDGIDAMDYEIDILTDKEDDDF